MIRNIKFYAPNITDLRLIYIVKVRKQEDVLADITLIGEEHQDIFTEAIKEVQKYIPNYSVDEIESIIHKMCQTTDTFTVEGYEFTVHCDCDCIEIIDL